MARSQTDEIRPLSFVGLCLDEALRTSTEKADWIVLIVGALLGPFGLLVPRWETTVTHLLLVAPLSALTSVLIFRLFCSPLLVYRKRDSEARNTEAALSKTIAEREGLSDSAMTRSAPSRKNRSARQLSNTITTQPRSACEFSGKQVLTPFAASENTAP